MCALKLFHLAKNVQLLVNCSGFKLLKYSNNSINIFSKDISRGFKTSIAMAHSKWEYVRTFESDEIILPNCWAVARIDGRGFHKLAKTHEWTRPNDERALHLMNKAAKTVMLEFSDIILAYGQSDEYSFVFRREAELFERRSVKVITTLVSKFSAAYVYNWNEYFPDEELAYPPSFDGRIVLYPTDQNLRDYLCWRQADCHINNLYNTTFWSLVQLGGLSNNDAEKTLCGTLSGDKNEILFSRFNINYNNEPQLYRKGTILVQPAKSRQLKVSRYRHKQKQKQKKADSQNTSKDSNLDTNLSLSALKEERENAIAKVAIELNCDIIGDTFWNEYPYLLNPQILLQPENNTKESQEENDQKVLTS